MLEELAMLAGCRQRDRGLVPTRWFHKWMTQISLVVALHVGRAIRDAVPLTSRYLQDGALFFDAGTIDDEFVVQDSVCTGPSDPGASAPGNPTPKSDPQPSGVDGVL